MYVNKTNMLCSSFIYNEIQCKNTGMGHETIRNSFLQHLGGKPVKNVQIHPQQRR